MWNFAQGSVAGTSHVRAGTVCQDRVGCRLLTGSNNVADALLIACVADGAGSARFSAEAAELATTEFIHAVEQRIHDGDDLSVDLIQFGFEAARQSIITRAAERNEPLREFATTLLSMVAGPKSTVIGQIGDGVILYRSQPGEWECPFWPQRGEYANMTRFITDEDYPDHLQVLAVEQQFSDIMLTSDGLQSLALHYASRSVHQPFCDGLFRSFPTVPEPGELKLVSEQICQFLASPRVTDRTDDDLSLVMASRCAAEP